MSGINRVHSAPSLGHSQEIELEEEGIAPSVVNEALQPPEVVENQTLQEMSAEALGAQFPVAGEGPLTGVQVSFLGQAEALAFAVLHGESNARSKEFRNWDHCQKWGAITYPRRKAFRKSLKMINERLGQLEVRIPDDLKALPMALIQGGNPTQNGERHEIYGGMMVFASSLGQMTSDPLGTFKEHRYWSLFNNACLLSVCGMFPMAQMLEGDIMFQTLKYLCDRYPALQSRLVAALEMTEWSADALEWRGSVDKLGDDYYLLFLTDSSIFKCIKGDAAKEESIQDLKDHPLIKILREEDWWKAPA